MTRSESEDLQEGVSLITDQSLVASILVPTIADHTSSPHNSYTPFAPYLHSCNHTVNASYTTSEMNVALSRPKRA